MFATKLKKWEKNCSALKSPRENITHLKKNRIILSRVFMYACVCVYVYVFVTDLYLLSSTPVFLILVTVGRCCCIAYELIFYVQELHSFFSPLPFPPPLPPPPRLNSSLPSHFLVSIFYSFFFFFLFHFCILSQLFLLQLQCPVSLCIPFSICVSIFLSHSHTPTSHFIHSFKSFRCFLCVSYT